MKIRPTTIVLFGITGDLSQKKLLPVMYDMYTKGELKNTKIVGFSRRDFKEDEIKAFVKDFLPKENFDQSFLNIITYISGQFDDKESYKKLSEHLLESCDREFGECSNKLFYLSVPPNFYETICTNISYSGLSIPCGGKDGFARILIEKPFGKDLDTAIKLDELLGELFLEEQIYRIDHYLAKESLVNILNIHRVNDLNKHRWNKEYIKKVEIELFETAEVGSRGASYDGVGALRDVGQNHMLQMVALVAMDIPKILNPESIQNERAAVLEEILPVSAEDFGKIQRGQYEGYTSESGVVANSNTETLFSLMLYINKGSFAGVPFVLRYGKALSKRSSQIKISFKDGTDLIIDIPSMDAYSAYKKIFQDCIVGDQTVFISTREVLAQWNYITPIVEATSNKQPFIYKKEVNPEDVFWT